MPAASKAPIADVPVKPKEVCGGAAEGVYGDSFAAPPALTGQLTAYVRNVNSRILGEWNQRSRHDFSSHVGKPHVTLVRFVIYPDGTYVDPEVTQRSGYALDDTRALAAIRHNTSFPALPAGMSHPVLMCMRFGYNTDLDGMTSAKDQQWLNKAVDKKASE